MVCFRCWVVSQCAFILHFLGRIEKACKMPALLEANPRSDEIGCIQGGMAVDKEANP